MLQQLIKQCQEEAKKELHGWTVNVLEHEGERKYFRKYLDTIISQTVERTLEAVVDKLGWRNRKDGTKFHDGHDVVVWYDNQIDALKAEVSREVTILEDKDTNS
jgi:hypothetical protein